MIDLLAEHRCDIVVVGLVKLLHYRALVQAEQVNLIVHAREGVGVVADGSCRGKTSLGHEEGLLRLHIIRAIDLDEAIHRCCDYGHRPRLLLCAS